MRSAKDILKELGFNSKASESTKEAFLKNLSQAAKDLEKAQVIEADFGSPESVTHRHVDEQLSFDSDLLGVKSSIRIKIGS